MSEAAVGIVSGFLDKETGFAANNSHRRSNNVQHRRTFHGRACKTFTKLGSSYKARSTL